MIKPVLGYDILKFKWFPPPSIAYTSKHFAFLILYNKDTVYFI